MNATATQSKTTTLLKQCLVDTYTLLIKTHNYHWNVAGPNFYSLHKLFEVQYNELFLAVDELAERLRALDQKAPGSIAEFAKITTITDALDDLSAEEMLLDLEKSNHDIIKSLTHLRDAAGENDPQTQDMAIGRIQTHNKNAWMLKASI
ncbi:MAG: DNA starvation/stationary phase protection protein [Candidatus Caenarcaniphilales bacterium]|jgi:starvation-inducible DNA-binding protein|nr:DNA starvation/stationary phase protection protein [Candidatus Caenarcaniphilales bacterium]